MAPLSNVLEGKFAIDGTDYQINDEFKTQASSLADLLSLDQIESAKVLVEGQQKQETLDRPALVSAALLFHERRSFIVGSLRLILKLGSDPDVDDVVRDLLVAALRLITGAGDGQEPIGSVLVQKCLSGMTDAQRSLDAVSEHVQKVATLGNASTPDIDEIMGFQQQHLTQQHESLGCIMAYLVKAKYASQVDFTRLQQQMSHIDKWNTLAAHYLPALVQFSALLNAADGAATHQEAVDMHKRIVDARNSQPWPLRSLQAAACVLWLAEFNGRFVDQDDNLLEAPDAEREAEARNKALMDALRDGAFECIISISVCCMPGDWYDPARTGLVRSLLGDSPLLLPEPGPLSPHFRSVAMEALASFCEAFITNMPDTLRQFKTEEEDQRRRNLASFQPNLRDNSVQQDRHLERFLVIMSYAYEGRPGSAVIFWEDQSSNLYGFLEWFSRRVSTALVGALCLMFRSLSEGEDCAEHAHKFLLEDAQLPSSRVRRATVLSWSQIFDELDFYAAKVREGPSASSQSASLFPGKTKPVESEEPETPVMLECYLQLTAHLCGQSALVRAWILSNSNFNLLDTAFLLCHGTVPARVRACAMACVEALLYGKSKELSEGAWNAFDHWVSSGFTQGLQVPRPVRGLSGASGWIEEVTLDAISSDFDETVALVSLLHQLVAMPVDSSMLSDCLPFPEALGSSYRMPGIEPYVDLVLGKIFTQNLPKLDKSSHSYVLAFRVLHLVETCLESFNEQLLHLTSKTNKNFDDCLTTSSLAAYVQLHPFARTIEWMFNEKVADVLFKIAHEDISEVNLAAADSPRAVALTAAIKVMILVMDLQSTFLDIVRPMLKSHSPGRGQTVMSPAVSSFEDCISANLRVVVDIAYYSGSGNQELALSSTELLKRLSESRKLNVLQRSFNSPRNSTNRLIGVLQQHQDVEPISRSLKQAMEIDKRELDLGHDSPAFKIKYAILDFLETTLAAHPDQPSLAHILLGFVCVGRSITAPSNGLFAERASLFHAVLDLSIVYPVMVDNQVLYWCVSLKSKAAHIVELLWSATITSESVLADMRIGDVLSKGWTRVVPVEADIVWDEAYAQDVAFVFTDAARTFDRFLTLRSNLLAYTATELRSIAGKGLSTLNATILATLQGRTETTAGEIAHPAILDLLDFLEIEPASLGSDPNRALLASIDLAPCLVYVNEGNQRFDMQLLTQLLNVEAQRLRKQGAIKDESAEEKLLVEIQDLCSYANGWNNSQALEFEKLKALEVWADLVTLFLINEQLPRTDRMVLVLKILQRIAPRMETYAHLTKADSLVFARLTQMLFSHLDLSPDDLDDERAAELAQIRLFQLFKICLRGTTNPDAPTALREILYNICYQYLTKLTGARASTADILQAVDSVGEGLINVICDDAYSEVGPVKVGATLLLAAIVEHASDASTHLVEALVRNNFVTVLIDVIRTMPLDLSNASPLGTCRPFASGQHRTNDHEKMFRCYWRLLIASLLSSWPSARLAMVRLTFLHRASSPPFRSLVYSPSTRTSA